MYAQYPNCNIAFKKYYKSFMYNPHSIHINMHMYDDMCNIYSKTCIFAMLRPRKDRIIGKKLDTKHRQRCMIWAILVK